MRFEDMIKNHNIFSFFISLFSSFHFSACNPSQDWLLWLTSWYSRHDPQAPSSIPFPFCSKPFPSTQRLFLVIKMLNHLGPQGDFTGLCPSFPAKDLLLTVCGQGIKRQSRCPVISMPCAEQSLYRAVCTSDFA